MRISQLVIAAVIALIPASLLSAQTAAARPHITGISHLCVYSADSAKTEQFYVHDMGAVKRDDPENPAGVRYYFSPVQFVEVLPLPAGWNSISRLDHVAFNTVSAEGLRTYLGAHGITVPEKVEKGSDGSRWFDVQDPEGNKVEFLQPPASPKAVPVNPLSAHIIHVGYLVHNADTENTFFRTLLGFRPYWHGGMTDTQTQWISQQVPNGTDWIEFMMVNAPETRGIPANITQSNLGTMDHFSLGVFNMEKTTNLLYAGDRLGVKQAMPKIGRDGKWQLNLYDPDGTRAEIMEFQAAVKPCCSAFTATSPTR